ncbi:MAG TPA: hypothetical protein VJ023_09105 [Pyrinomonadaceae bacterium]|nr:hypothetical protein [Pyrinomonadaceae bacterium]
MRSCLYVAVHLAVVVMLMIPTSAAGGRGGFGENVGQQSNKVILSVEDPRPVAKAIVMLEGSYGWTITYEDPRYGYAAEITDVTEKVRRDLHKYQKGAAPRVFIPKGGELVFEYYVVTPTNLPPDPGLVVQQLLDAQAASANSARFRMERSDKLIHVIPIAIKNSTGKLVPQESVLDAVITLPAKERTGLQTLEALCTAISKRTHMPVIVGAIPLTMFLQHKDQEGADSQRARETLSQLLERTGKGMKLSWQLFYDPGMKIYALNIHVV